MVKVVYFKVDKEPEVGNMTNTVEGMKSAIGGGYVQILNIGIDNIVILCDEEGLMKELHYNRCLLGDWPIVGTGGEEFISLTDQQVEWIKQNINDIMV